MKVEGRIAVAKFVVFLLFVHRQSDFSESISRISNACSTIQLPERSLFGNWREVLVNQWESLNFDSWVEHPSAVTPSSQHTRTDPALT